MRSIMLGLTLAAAATLAVAAPAQAADTVTTSFAQPVASSDGVSAVAESTTAPIKPALADTGADFAPMAITAAGLLLVGGVLIVVQLRRARP
jgi:LPXTG-motif cell wall-anchored protein